MAELACSPDRPLKAEDIAGRQDIPVRFLFVVLSELRQARLVRSVRGPDGGYTLARPPRRSPSPMSSARWTGPS